MDTKEVRLLIIVTNKGFRWLTQAQPGQIAPQLVGPSSCRHEKLRVIREGVIADEAVIRHIGTMGSYDGFEGLEKIAGSSYHMELRVEMFKDGDLIFISGLPDGVSEAEYWRDLTAGKAVEVP